MTENSPSHALHGSAHNSVGEAERDPVSETTHSSAQVHDQEQVPPRRRGKIILDAPACTSCMVCVRECPVWCIELDATKVHDPNAGPRGKSRLELTTFTIDYGLCMDCGICIDVCPTDALSWDPVPFAVGAQRPDFTPELS